MPSNALRARLTLEHLELAKGYDGLLRGTPEPTLIAGLYAIDSSTRLLGRYLYRFQRPAEFPTKVAPRKASKEQVTFTRGAGTRVVAVVLAVEEDSGAGLPRLFAALEQAEAIVAWTDQGTSSLPTPLCELCTAEGLAPGRGHDVHVMFGQHDPSKELAGDDWIGAGLLWVAGTPTTSADRVHRMNFVSADTRNDWTLQFELMIRPA